MLTATYIRRHIFRLPKATMFTTRELLIYGSRAAVNQTLYRLVKHGVILRLARGLFVRAVSGIPLPTASEAVVIKANAFGKQIVSHALDAAAAIGLASCGNSEPTYCTSGRTSSFHFRDTVIHLKGTSNRKMNLGDSRIGIIVRSLWQLGQTDLTIGLIQDATLDLRRTERLELKQLVCLMPGWLSDHFHQLWHRKVKRTYCDFNTQPGLRANIALGNRY